MSLTVQTIARDLPSRDTLRELSHAPALLTTPSFVLEALGVEHAALDYAALMSCRARLRRELQWKGWPPEGFTLAENEVDLARHRNEYDEGSAFALTVLTPERDVCIGCLYLELFEEQPGCKLFWWLVDDALPMEPVFFEEVMSWATEFNGPVVAPIRATNTRALGLMATLGMREIEITGIDAHHCFVLP